MRTYIPRKHNEFWKVRIFAASYGMAKHQPLIKLVFKEFNIHFELSTGEIINPKDKLNNHVQHGWNLTITQP